jgi:hypothetical protein
MPVAGQQEPDSSQRPVLVGEEVQELPLICGHVSTMTQCGRQRLQPVRASVVLSRLVAVLRWPEAVLGRHGSDGQEPAPEQIWILGPAALA